MEIIYINWKYKIIDIHNIKIIFKIYTISYTINIL